MALVAAAECASSSTSTSSTTNVLSCLRLATGTSGCFQKASDERSNVRPVVGSRRRTLPPTAVTMAHGEPPAAPPAMLRGTRTRSPRLIGATSTDHVWRTFEVPSLLFAAMTALDAFERHGARLWRSETNRCACCRRAKWKSRPSFVRLTSIGGERPSSAWRLIICCSMAKRVRGCSARWRTCTLAIHAS